MRFTRIPPHLRTLYSALVLGVVATMLIAFGLQSQSFVRQAELSAYDWQFQSRGAQSMPNDIAIVGVDAASIKDLEGPNKTAIPRAAVGNAVTFLKKAGAKVIGIDFRYPAASQYGSRDDAQFVKAIKAAGNVVAVDIFPTASASNFIQSQQSVELPIDPILHAVAGVGLANYPLDDDNKVRTALLMQNGPGGATPGSKLFPTFPLVIAGKVLNEPVDKVASKLPEAMQINYVGGQPAGDPSIQSFHTYQFEGVSRGEDNPRIFKNKIVLIIPMALDFKDVLDSPYGPMYGGFVHANTLNTILRDNPITAVGDTTNTLILVLVGLLITLIAARFGIWRSTVATLVLAAGYVGLAIFLFRDFRVWINVLTPEVLIIMVFALIMALRFGTEERLKRKTSKAFSLYLRPEVVDILVNSDDPDGALEPRRRPISVLFVDVRGFTAASEKLQPEQVVRLLDVYLEELTLSVQNYQGTLNKYVGDEIMAMWNTPLDQPDHPMLSVKAGLDMVARMERINDALTSQGLPPVTYGIGINSGDAVVGQMGSTFRKQFDIIGDTVNTAARLCSAAAGGEILIAEETWRLIGDQLELEEMDPIRVKGKSQELRTFKVLGTAPALEGVVEGATATVSA